MGEPKEGLRPFRFSVPGTPPSTNHLYNPIIRTTGGGSYRSMKKADGVGDYQFLARYCVTSALPRDWKLALVNDTKSQLRVKYWFHLKQDMDCSNAFKALEDAIATALGVNDRRFLPCAAGKVVDRSIDPFVEVEITFE